VEGNHYRIPLWKLQVLNWYIKLATKQLHTQGVTHRIVNTLSILRDLEDPYTSEYPAPQCMADVEA